MELLQAYIIIFNYLTQNTMSEPIQAVAIKKAAQLTPFGEMLKDQLTLANEFFKAGCFGGDVKNAHQAFVKIQAGKEMGMPPMEAMNSLYIINGSISIYGVATAKRLREHGWIISYKNEDAKGVTAVITKGREVHEFEATAVDVARLSSKALGFAPKDKLRWHALGRLVRFNVPEVLGPVRYLKEEAETFSALGGPTTAKTALDSPAPKAAKVVEKAPEAPAKEEEAAVTLDPKGSIIGSPEDAKATIVTPPEDVKRCASCKFAFSGNLTVENHVCEKPTQEPLSDLRISRLEKMLETKGQEGSKLLDYYKVDKFEDMSVAQYEKGMTILKALPDLAKPEEENDGSEGGEGGLAGSRPAEPAAAPAPMTEEEVETTAKAAHSIYNDA